MGTSKAAKKRRKALREAAMATIVGMSDEELKNAACEIGRSKALLSVQQNELSVRLDAIRSEQEKRRTSTPQGIHISDHAVVRYLERHKGLDVAAVREEIVALAERSKTMPQTETQRGRLHDEETNLIIGFDENRQIVTTIMEPREAVVLEQ